MKDYLAAIYSPAVEPKLKKAAGPEIDFRQGRRDDPQIRCAGAEQGGHPPDEMDVLECHVDGLNLRTTVIVEREGVFKECIEAIKMAKILGYQVATETRPFYKETDVAEIEDMFKFLSSLEVDGHTIRRVYEIRRGEEGHGHATRQAA